MSPACLVPVVMRTSAVTAAVEMPSEVSAAVEIIPLAVSTTVEMIPPAVGHGGEDTPGCRSQLRSGYLDRG